MLSNKLTFSLVLVLMCAFVVTSAFGQDISAPNLNILADNTLKPDDSDTDTDLIRANSFVVYQKNGTPSNGIVAALVSHVGRHRMRVTSQI